MSNFMVGDLVNILPAGMFDSHYGIGISFWEDYRKKNPFEIKSVNIEYETVSYQLRDTMFDWPEWGLELHSSAASDVPIDDLL